MPFAGADKSDEAPAAGHEVEPPEPADEALKGSGDSVARVPDSSLPDFADLFGDAEGSYALPPVVAPVPPPVAAEGSHALPPVVAPVPPPVEEEDQDQDSLSAKDEAPPEEEEPPVVDRAFVTLMWSR